RPPPRESRPSWTARNGKAARRVRAAPRPPRGDHSSLPYGGRPPPGRSAAPHAPGSATQTPPRPDTRCGAPRPPAASGTASLTSPGIREPLLDTGEPGLNVGHVMRKPVRNDAFNLGDLRRQPGDMLLQRGYPIWESRARGHPRPSRLPLPVIKEVLDTLNRPPHPPKNLPKDP